MKKHVRLFLGLFVVALVGGYVGLRSQNAELEQQVQAGDTVATSTTDGGDAS